MKTLVITGGIATGKSEALGRFKGDDIAVFSADASVNKLYQSEEVLMKVSEVIGDDAVIRGEADRNWIREKIFSDAEAKKRLETLLHPLVREDLEKNLEKSRQRGDISVFLAEIPLLYENRFKFSSDGVIVVAASPNTQIYRLCRIRGLNLKTAKKILCHQLSLERKLSEADIVFWNEGKKRNLEFQVKRFIENRYQ